MISIFGNPVHLPADLFEHALEKRCRELEDELNRLTEKVNRMSGNGQIVLRP